MNRPLLKAVAHIAARRLFDRAGSESIEPDIINRELLAICADPRNHDMTQQQFRQAAETFIPRELERLARRRRDRAPLLSHRMENR